jgi:hypothetical protein
MLPKKVSTRPKIEEAVTGEEKLNIAEMVETAIKEAQIINVLDPWNEDEHVEGQACPLTFSYQE